MGWKPDPLWQREADPEEVANKMMGRWKALIGCRCERKLASSSSSFGIAVTLAAHAAKEFKYGNTSPREQQLAQLAFVVVVEEHIQLN